MEWQLDLTDIFSHIESMNNFQEDMAIYVKKAYKECTEKKGCHFQFVFQRGKDHSLALSGKEMLVVLTLRCHEFLKEFVGLDTKKGVLRETEEFTPEKGSFIGMIPFFVAGTGLFLISLPHAAVEKLLHSLSGPDVGDMADLMRLDAVSEMTNIILGNSLSFFPRLISQTVQIKSPFSLSVSHIHISQKGGVCFQQTIESELGKIELVLIKSD